jgi:hypothetical protein
MSYLVDTDQASLQKAVMKVNFGALEQMAKAAEEDRV